MTTGAQLTLTDRVTQVPNGAPTESWNPSRLTACSFVAFLALGVTVASGLHMAKVIQIPHINTAKNAWLLAGTSLGFAATFTTLAIYNAKSTHQPMQSATVAHYKLAGKEESMPVTIATLFELSTIKSQLQRTQYQIVHVPETNKYYLCYRKDGEAQTVELNVDGQHLTADINLDTMTPVDNPVISAMSVSIPKVGDLRLNRSLEALTEEGDYLTCKLSADEFVLCLYAKGKVTTHKFSSHKELNEKVATIKTSELKNEKYLAEPFADVEVVSGPEGRFERTKDCLKKDNNWAAIQLHDGRVALMYLANSTLHEETLASQEEFNEKMNMLGLQQVNRIELVAAAPTQKAVMAFSIRAQRTVYNTPKAWVTFQDKATQKFCVCYQGNSDITINSFNTKGEMEEEVLKLQRTSIIEAARSLVDEAPRCAVPRAMIEMVPEVEDNKWVIYQLVSTNPEEHNQYFFSYGTHKKTFNTDNELYEAVAFAQSQKLIEDGPLPIQPFDFDNNKVLHLTTTQAKDIKVETGYWEIYREESSNTQPGKEPYFLVYKGPERHEFHHTERDQLSTKIWELIQDGSLQPNGQQKYEYQKVPHANHFTKMSFKDADAFGKKLNKSEFALIQLEDNAAGSIQGVSLDTTGQFAIISFDGSSVIWKVNANRELLCSSYDRYIKEGMTFKGVSSSTSEADEFDPSIVIVDSVPSMAGMKKLHSSLSKESDGIYCLAEVHDGRYGAKWALAMLGQGKVLCFRTETRGLQYVRDQLPKDLKKKNLKELRIPYTNKV